MKGIEKLLSFIMDEVSIKNKESRGDGKVDCEFC